MVEKDKGNPQVEDGFVKIANELLEALLQAMAKGLITARERAIIDYIIRYTYGFQKMNGYFKASYIAEKLGLVDKEVMNLIRQLIRKNILYKKDNELGLNKHYRQWSKGNETVTHKKVTIPLPKSNETVTSGNDAVTKSNDAVTKKAEADQIKTILVKPLKEIFINTKKEKEVIKKEKILFNTQTKKFENITPEDMKKWREVFSNVESELKKMEIWLDAHPEKRYKNYKKFIFNWLSNQKGGQYVKNGISRYVPISKGHKKYKAEYIP